MHAADDVALRTASDANRRFYGSLTAGRDDYWRLMAAPRFRVRRILSLLADGNVRSVADLGCGNGQLLEEIARRFPSSTLAGVDLSEPQIAANRDRQPKVGWHARDLQRLITSDDPLAGKFETIIASELIEHVADPLLLLRNARVLAAPGARLIVSTQSGPVRATERHVGHQRHFTANVLTALLAEAGWKPVRVWNEGFPFHDLSKWAANINPEGALRAFDQQAYGPFKRLICAILRGAFHLNSRSRGAQLFAVAALADRPTPE